MVWVTVFRSIANILLLAMIAIRAFAGGHAEGLTWEDSASFAVIVTVFAATALYSILLKAGRAGKALAYTQVMGDVALASALVILTGGVDSPFAFTYLLAIVVGSILLFQRGALLAAFASVLAFGLSTYATHDGWFPMLPWAPITLSRWAVTLVSNMLAQLLIAALSGYLSRQLWAAGGALSDQEATLKKLATLQRQILANMPSGLVTCDAKGDITFVNRAAASILRLDSIAPPHKRVTDLLPGVFGLVNAKRGELSVMTAGGSKTLGLSVASLEGSPGAHLIVFQDLTELRRAEEELKRVDRLAALGKMAAQLAHEIRNPLASMRGSAQMLAKEAPPEGSSQKLAGILIRESDRLSKLLEDFLRFARPPTPQLELCSLKQLVGDVMEMMQADPLSRGVRLRVQLADVAANVDSDQIRQVLINIVRNALVAVGEGGEVRVTLESVENEPLIRVWDSAGSIPPSDLTRIFEPFYTTREGGTGLGLSTAHSIVRAHGGMIHVTSSPSLGTEFVIGLPPVSKEVAA
jgi:two-component system, NtrC family, sensor histidine kinase PilS